ncbi:zinc finger protein 343-like [Erpetoichthys calabaricus]|uniref:zinc finger protein 343-like n=1 Tax=Erpetoichthys calabaricus TaxID=27687 RepID=UPI002234BAF0|nr:zinc finger protein 343-like [Erpetoichthys calabaricus]
MRRRLDSISLLESVEGISQSDSMAGKSERIATATFKQKMAFHKSALDILLNKLMEAMDNKCADFQAELLRKEKEIASLKLQLEISRQELRIVRGRTSCGALCPEDSRCHGSGDLRGSFRDLESKDGMDDTPCASTSLLDQKEGDEWVTAVDGGGQMQDLPVITHVWGNWKGGQGMEDTSMETGDPTLALAFESDDDHDNKDWLLSVSIEAESPEALAFHVLEQVAAQVKVEDAVTFNTSDPGSGLGNVPRSESEEPPLLTPQGFHVGMQLMGLHDENDTSSEQLGALKEENESLSCWPYQANPSKADQGGANAESYHMLQIMPVEIPAWTVIPKTVFQDEVINMQPHSPLPGEAFYTPAGVSATDGAEVDRTPQEVLQGVEAQQPSTMVSQTFSCFECKKQYKYKSSYQKHKKTHKVNNQFPCLDCGRAFSQLTALKIHQRIHTKGNSFTCHDCGQRFSSSSDLHKHQRLHTAQKPFPCSQCDKAFSHSSTLKAHQRIHTEETPLPSRSCGNSLSDSSEAKKEQQPHSKEKLNTCNRCKRNFAHLAALKSHMKTHND